MELSGQVYLAEIKTKRQMLADFYNLNCNFRYINGEQADPDLVKHFPVSFEDRGLETSTLGLRFKVRDKHFKHGDLKLKCTAVIATIYWKSNEESVQGVRPQSALVSESRSSRNSGNKNQSVEKPKRKSKVVNQRIPGVYGQNINQRVVSRG